MTTEAGTFPRSETISRDNLATALGACTAVAAFGPSLIARLLDLPDSSQAALRIVMLYGYFAVSAGLCVWMALLSDWRNLAHGLSRQYLLLAGLAAFALSIAVGGFHFRPMMLLAIGYSTLVFYFLSATQTQIDARPVAWMLGILSAVPVMLHFVGQMDLDFWVSESFRGFGDSRSDFAYYAGLAAVLALVMRNRWLWLLSIPVLMGLAASASRAALLSLLFALLVAAIILVRRRELVRVAVIGVAAVFVLTLPYMGAIEVGRQITMGSDVKAESGADMQQIGILADYNGRTDIYRNALQDARENWLFGAGDYFQTTHIGEYPIEAHNAVLQSVMNFGVIVTVLWFALLAVLFWRSSLVGKAALSFWIVYAQFQPGADAFLFVPESLLVLLIAAGSIERHLT